jgi:hypothetical protein
MSMTHKEAKEFFAIIFRGEHHIPSTIKPFGFGYSITMHTPMATYDGDLLTRFVLLAHMKAIRVEITPTIGRKFKVAIHKRGKVGYMYERHPDIEEANARFMEGL